jgi:hypothetical protein
MPRLVLYTNCNLTECNLSWVRGGGKTPRECEVNTASDRACDEDDGTEIDQKKDNLNKW